MSAVSVYRVPIIGWDVRSIYDSDGDPDANLAFPIVAGTVDAAGDYSVSATLIELPGLQLHAPGSCIYRDLEEAKADVLEQAQRAYDRKKK
jgi:hypothetical protein